MCCAAKASPCCWWSRTCRSRSRPASACISWKKAPCAITRRHRSCTRTTKSSTNIWGRDLLEQILIQTINGIVVGMILALVASGLTLIFGIMDVVNFAHGELFMLGAYVAAITLGGTGSFWLALLVATLVVRGLGAASHVTTWRHLPGGA